jgi:hypothetical protein
MSAQPMPLELAMQRFPPLYVIYRRPRDFPGEEVVMRAWFGMTPHDMAFGFKDIEGARRTANRMGACFCLLPDADDDPVIVESWV